MIRRLLTARSHKCQQRYGKYIKEQPLEQSEPTEPPESIPLPSEDVPIEQFDSSPELQPTIVTGSATLGSPPEIENREALYFKHMHLTLPDQAKATDVQPEPNTPDPTSHEPESKMNAAKDFEYDADVELHKGEADLGSDDEEGVLMPETQYGVGRRGEYHTSQKISHWNPSHGRRQRNDRLLLGCVSLHHQT